MYVHSKTWGTRPSELLNLVDGYAAFCLDEAVAYFGNTLADELSDITDKNPKRAAAKQERHLAKRLGLPLKFADPAMRR